MTLIVNVLHKDFSLLAADRLANATGPATLTTGGLTITLVNGGRVIGAFPKIITTTDGSAAVGSAGTIQEHTYVEAFKSAATPQDGLTAVRDAAHAFFDLDAGDQLINRTPQMINESITSYFDVEKGAFWSFIIKYTRFDNFHQTYVRRANPIAEVFSVGSDNQTVHEQVSGEELGNFVNAIARSWSEPQLAQWLDDLFAKVSVHNDSISAEYDAFIVTRENPVFKPLQRSDAVVDVSS